VSLIDEALKRAELEAARRDGLRGRTYPWVPDRTLKRSRHTGVITAVVTIAAVGAIGWWWFSRDAVQGSKFKDRGRESEVSRFKVQTGPMETVEVAPPPASLSPRAPASARPAQSGKTGGANASLPSSAATESATTKKSQAETQASAPPGPRTGGSVAEGKPAGRGLVEGRTYVGEVAVPDGGKIALEGIVYSESNPVALINGRVLPPGAVVEEFTIVSIEADRVALKGRGMTIFLALK
jgi:hypothetical protein